MLLCRVTLTADTFRRTTRHRTVIVADRHAVGAMRLFAPFATFSKHAFDRVVNEARDKQREGNPSYQRTNSHRFECNTMQEAFQC